jgi:hypothetical protein
MVGGGEGGAAHNMDSRVCVECLIQVGKHWQKPQAEKPILCKVTEFPSPCDKGGPAA